jgi:plastocyanin
MNEKLVGLLLFAVILVTSGCLDQAVDEQMPEEDLQNMSPESQGTQDAENTTEENEVDRTIEVAGGSYYFEPDNIQVEQGETIEFTLVNEGGFHDMVIPELDAGTDRINGGDTESFTVTFEETGEYEFICSVGTHAQQGMAGTITVS